MNKSHRHRGLVFPLCPLSPRRGVSICRVFSCWEVCGTGVDAFPLFTDFTTSQTKPFLRNAIAARLRLTARLFFFLRICGEIPESERDPCAAVSVSREELKLKASRSRAALASFCPFPSDPDTHQTAHPARRGPENDKIPHLLLVFAPELPSMRGLVPVLSIILAAAARVVVAQDHQQQQETNAWTSIVQHLPPCAVACLDPARRKSTCVPTDLDCACGVVLAAPLMEGCVLTQCKPRDALSGFFFPLLSGLDDTPQLG